MKRHVVPSAFMLIGLEQQPQQGIEETNPALSNWATAIFANRRPDLNRQPDTYAM